MLFDDAVIDSLVYYHLGSRNCFLPLKTHMYPSLEKSYKNKYPFKLCTTSFIYPDDYIPNVKMLGPYIDEVELLLFEARREEYLPTRQVIRDLAVLSEEFDFTYNIHLPTDLPVTDKNPQRRQQAVEIIKRVIDLSSPLHPTTHTLHLPYDMDRSDSKTITQWQDIANDSIEKLVHSGIQADMLSVETLSYPFHWLDPVLESHCIPVCIDIGHLIVQNFDYVDIFNKYKDKTTIIHLHGVKEKKDHIPLDNLPQKDLQRINHEILKKFNGVLSIEVFSFDYLSRSLNCLNTYW